MKLSRTLPMNALRVFEAVARLANFTRAAEELGMTQTAVSYQIKLLEDHIGNAVFLRRPRALQLTETGKRLLPKVADAFSLLEEAMRSASGVLEETLEIHSTPTFASHWLARRLGEFQLLHPHIAVRLVRHTAPNDSETMSGDVAIRIAEKPFDGLTCHPILRLTYTPMLKPELADTIGGINVPTDILRLPWISDTEDTWPGWFEAMELDPAGIRHVGLHTFGALDLQANAAIAGQGVAMLSPLLFHAELTTGRLVQPFDTCIGDTKVYWLCHPPARRNSAKIKAFLGWLREALAKDLAASAGGELPA